MFDNPLADKIHAYSIPNKFVQCRFLRIHLTSVIDETALSTTTSGLIIQEIFGATVSGNVSLDSNQNKALYL
jgi:hypothetical protein